MIKPQTKEILFIENTPPPATLTKRCAEAKEISSNYVSALTKSRRSTLEIIMARNVAEAGDEDYGHWVEVQVPKSINGKILSGQSVRYMMYEIKPEIKAA